jgi:hypothetical protein
MTTALEIPAQNTNTTTAKRKMEERDVSKEEIGKPPAVKTKKVCKKDDSENKAF